MYTLTNVCVDCGLEFSYGCQHRNTIRLRSRCCGCQKLWQRVLYQRSLRKRHPEKQHGVGSGHAQGSGASHHSFQTGINAKCFRRIAFAAHGKVCVHCGTTERLCVHHKDHNRYNNEASNLEVACFRCHRMVCHADYVVRDAKGKFVAVKSKNAEVKSGKKSGNPSNGQSDWKARFKKRVTGND